MERHDYELKEREDSLIDVTSESALVISFELEMYFKYKGKNYGACCTYEVEGRGICNIEMYELNKADELPQHLFDELFCQVRDYFQEFDIDKNDLLW